MVIGARSSAGDFHCSGFQGDRRAVVRGHGFEVQLLLVRVVHDEVAFGRGEKHHFERRFLRLGQLHRASQNHCPAAGRLFDVDRQVDAAGLAGLIHRAYQLGELV